jgi:cell division protein FtsZ
MRVTVVATGLNRPSDFAVGARRSSMSRLVSQTQSISRQTSSQAVRPAPRPPTPLTGEDSQRH